MLPKIQIVSVDSADELAERLSLTTRFFTLLLAWDCDSVEFDQLKDLLRPLVNAGMVYFCGWGKGSRAAEDAVDMCVVDREMIDGELSYVLMTTQHEDESLEDAFWFFDMLAIPGEPEVFDDFARFAVAVGNSEWEDRLMCALTSQGDECPKGP